MLRKPGDVLNEGARVTRDAQTIGFVQKLGSEKAGESLR